VYAGLLTEMINSRLFTTVRDSLGLTYDVSFELSLFDRLPSGWFHVNVTSTPQVPLSGCVLCCPTLALAPCSYALPLRSPCL
jgi:hypothetical protein